MKPEEWPIAVPSAGLVAEPARGAGRGRLPTVVTDFYLDPAQRLTDQERALMSGMLARLVGSVADQIIAALPNGQPAADDEDQNQLLIRLVKAGMLAEPQLVGALLRRADEERIATAVRTRSGVTPTFLQALIGSPDDKVSGAAMELILAGGRRRDRLGQPKIDFNDLPAAVAGAFADAVAAGLRSRLQPLFGRDTDSILDSARSRLIDQRDESRSIDALGGALARLLNDAAMLDEALLQSVIEEGDVAFLTHALAELAGISAEAVWEHLVLGVPEALEVMLRMANLPRPLAGRLLGSLGDLLGVADVAEAIARFDRLDEHAVAAAREQLRLEPGYRAAIEKLEGADGQRAH